MHFAQLIPLIVLPPPSARLFPKEIKQVTLICNVSDHSSGPKPPISWMCRETGGDYSNITGNRTASETCQNQNSKILLFNASVECNSSEITCAICTDIPTDKNVTEEAQSELPREYSFSFVTLQNAPKIFFDILKLIRLYLITKVKFWAFIC